MSFVRQRSPHDLANLALLSWPSLQSAVPAYTGKLGDVIGGLSSEDSTTPGKYPFNKMAEFCHPAGPVLSNQKYGMYCCGSRETFHDQRSLTIALHKLEIVVRDPYRWISDFPVVHVVPIRDSGAPEAIGDPDILIDIKVNALDGASSQPLRLGALCRQPSGRLGETLPTFSDMLEVCQTLLQYDGRQGFDAYVYDHKITISNEGA